MQTGSIVRRMDGDGDGDGNGNAGPTRIPDVALPATIKTNATIIFIYYLDT